MARHSRWGKKKNALGIPEGWLDCPSMATGFVDDRFFVFKTPLKPELNTKVPQSQRFNSDSVIGQLRQMNDSRVGLWIDLTNTDRYYDATQIRNLGIQYQKISCEGHGRPPAKYVIYEFCNLVQYFFRRNYRDYVAVHCTHGFNRTGFLICCYLIRFRKYSAAEAVEEFAKHRSPGIYRQSYIDELFRMTVPILPPIQVTQPEWLCSNASTLDQNWRANPLALSTGEASTSTVTNSTDTGEQTSTIDNENASNNL